MNLPNKLTLLRVILVPVFIAFMTVNTLWANIAGLIIFIIASLTDMLDGKIARARNLVSGHSTCCSSFRRGYCGIVLGQVQNGNADDFNNCGYCAYVYSLYPLHRTYNCCSCMDLRILYRCIRC